MRRLQSVPNRLFSTVALAAALALLVTSPLPASTLVIDGATVHPLSGPEYVGRVVIEDGLIREAGPEIAVPEGAERLDATGLHLYPGLFDAFSQLGLVEIGSVDATDDTAEAGAYNPQLRALTAIHPASELLPVARANGITHSVVAPRAPRDGVLPGQASLVHLDGWTVEEMALDPAIGMVLSWPEIQTRSFDFTTFTVKNTPYTEAKEKAEEAQDELVRWIDAARHYKQAMQAGSNRLERDLRLEALAGVLDGGQPIFIQAQAKKDIEAAVAFAEKQGLRMILVGGRDAWEVADLLAEKEVPVILGFTLSLPRNEDDPYDLPFRNAAYLQEAGVTIAFASGAGGGFGPGGPHASRTLPYEAANAVAHGLPAEEALKALTVYPARMLGLGDRLGTIEPGRVANLILTDGNPLDITTQVEHLVIDGRVVSTDNRHQRLYEHYRSRHRAGNTATGN